MVGLDVEKSTVGTIKSRQPILQKSLNLVQSRQSLKTVRQAVPTITHFFSHYPFTLVHVKEHTCCISMWFTSVQTLFRPYVQRWRVSASKLMGNIFCL